MKKFINRTENLVEEMLQGLAVLYPGATRLAGHKVLMRSDAASTRDQQVAVISGGGSGHEPAHAGYIGRGMLSAAVAGEVFTSPGSDAVFAAIQAVAGQRGALLVVKNYTGDRLNFGLAAEMARAQATPVEMLIVDDDVALSETPQPAGARGLAGTVLVHKLVGAAAAEGAALQQLAAIGREAVATLGTMGVSFSAGTSPAVGRPSFDLGPQEMELGLGIHGEPGVARRPWQPANELVQTLLGKILHHRNFPQSVAVMINNLGATTPMELAIVARHAAAFLRQQGILVERLYAGTFLSSLDMAGVSLSILGLDEQRLRWLDAGTTAPAWPNLLPLPPGRFDTGIATQEVTNQIRTTPVDLTPNALKMKRAIEAACEALILAQDELTELDRLTGDGDLGSSMARASRAVQQALGSYPLNDTSATLKALAETLRRELGGSSGPLYAVFLLRSAAVLESQTWLQALQQGCDAISELGGAKPGDRTMLDALRPFVDQLNETHGAVTAALEALDRGVQATAQMKPRLGRSSYLGDRALGHLDPGAKAVSICLRAVCESLFPNRNDKD